jgi:RimJ/RimL family protein N-acetyltransferase
MLTGERVTLRPVRPEDLPTLYEWKVDLATWEATTDVPAYPMTYDEYREYAEKKARDPQGNADFVAEVGGVLVGRGGLFAFDPLTHCAEVGISFGPEHRNKGYGQETLRLLVDFGFRHRNLHRIWLETLASNAAALRCYTKVGFVEEGRLREHAWVDGAYEDMVRMGLLRAEWQG